MAIHIVNGVEVEVSEGFDAAFRATITPPVITYNSASRLGLKRALVKIGRWAEVKALIESDPDIAEDWQLCTEVNRADVMFKTAVASGSFIEADIDEVFRLANNPAELESPGDAIE